MTGECGTMARWVAGLVVLATALEAFAGGYELIELGDLGGGYYNDHSAAYAINNAGQVAGYAGTASGELHATVFDTTGGGQNTDLGALDVPRGVLRSGGPGQ